MSVRRQKIKTRRNSTMQLFNILLFCAHNVLVLMLYHCRKTFTAMPRVNEVKASRFMGQSVGKRSPVLYKCVNSLTRIEISFIVLH